MAPADNTVARTLHDLGLAAWFGGSLMGATGLNGASAAVEDPTPAAAGGQQRLGSLDPAEPGRHRRPSRRRGVAHRANKSGQAGQQGVAATSTIKTALTVAALGITAYARVLGKRLERARDVPVEDSLAADRQLRSVLPAGVSR